MNLAKIMIPKVTVVFIYDHSTVRQGLETMAHHGYTAIPVLDADDRYIGSVSEGDFLRCVMELGTTDKHRLETVYIRDILRKDFITALPVNADEGVTVEAALKQNYVPIVDDRNALCGLLTRRRLIKYLAKKGQ